MTKKIEINSLILKQIANRYEAIEFGKLSTGQRNYGIIDSAVPYEEYYSLKYNEGYYKFPPGCIAISEPIAKRYNLPRLHISELCTIFGHTKTSIKKILTEVKKKNIDLGMIGFGGTGTNFFHWLSEMAEWTNTNRIFKRFYIYDNDFFDSVNLLRVPFVLKQKKDITHLLPKVHYCNDYAGIATQFNKIQENLTPKNLTKNMIYYGAPDLETRKIMHENNVAFIAATHRDNACMLSLRPEIDTELQIETYGKISLSIFFLNHLKMTISFLEYLASDISLKEMETTTKTILEYDFAEENEEMIIHGTRIGGRTIYPITANKDNRAIMEVA